MLKFKIYSYVRRVFNEYTTTQGVAHGISSACGKHKNRLLILLPLTTVQDKNLSMNVLYLLSQKRKFNKSDTKHYHSKMPNPIPFTESQDVKVKVTFFSILQLISHRLCKILWFKACYSHYVL